MSRRSKWWIIWAPLGALLLEAAWWVINREPPWAYMQRPTSCPPVNLNDTVPMIDCTGVYPVEGYDCTCEEWEQPAQRGGGGVSRTCKNRHPS